MTVRVGRTGDAAGSVHPRPPSLVALPGSRRTVSPSADPPIVVRSGASPLSSPREFVADWAADVRRAPPAAWLLFQRHLTQQFRQSSLGLLLAFAPAVTTALVFTYGRRINIFAADTGGVNSAFFSVFGMLLAQTFLETLQSGRRLFAGSQIFLRRQSASLEPPVLAAVLDAGFHAAIRTIVLAGLMVLFAVRPAPTAPLAILGIAGLSLCGLGLGFLLAPSSALRQDLNVLLSGLPIILFTVTPVFLVPPPESFLGRIHALNPLSWLFNGIRAAAYGGHGSVLFAAAAPFVGFLLLGLGWALCRVARPHIVERMIT